MKKLTCKHILVLLVALLLPLGTFAQEKNLAYYNSHESEILPDAQAAFKKGDYDRALELCRWHYIIFGDDVANVLRDKSERCAILSNEMAELQADGNVKEAKQKASAILSLNPDDASAKAVLSVEEPIPVVQDTVVVVLPSKPDIQESIDGLENQNKETQVEESVTDPIGTMSAVEPSTPKPTYEPHTRFVIKAGASILDLKQLSQTFAAGGSIGLYDMGGSRMGLEAGGYACPGLSSVSASLIGVDAGLVIRAAKGIYPKVGVGFFSCKSTEYDDAATQGLCSGASLTFLLGNHFCIEIGANYYPVVKVVGIEPVTTSGVSYDFPISKEILAGGIAPVVRIGWAF